MNGVERTIVATLAIGGVITLAGLGIVDGHEAVRVLEGAIAGVLGGGVAGAIVARLHK